MEYCKAAGDFKDNRTCRNQAHRHEDHSTESDRTLARVSKEVIIDGHVPANTIKRIKGPN